MAFERVELAAGETRAIVLRVPWARLQVWEDEWVLPTGTYVLTVGHHSADLDAVDLVTDRA